VHRKRRPRRRIFSLHHQRVVNRDNTAQFENRCLQIEPVRWRGTLAGCAVTVRQHLDGDLSLSYGQHLLGRYPGHHPAIRAPGPQAVENQKPDRSLAMKSGHLHLLRTL
jgi:hypothetical protein